MDSLLISLTVVCFVAFAVTSFMIGRILIEQGLKESMFYNFDNWNLFSKLIKEQKSLSYKVLFWANISSFLAFVVLIIIAANYYY